MNATIEIHPDEKTWLEARRQSTGSSGIMNILGVPTDGREPNGLWWEWVRSNPNAWEHIGEDGRTKFQEIEAKGFKNLNLPARRAMEPVIEGWAIERIGALRDKVQIVDPGDFCIYRSKKDPRKHVSPDGIAVDLSLWGPDKTLAEWPQILDVPHLQGFTEYKTISPFATHHWGDEPSEYAQYQVQWGMLVSGLEVAYVAGQVGYGDNPDRDQLFYEVERHGELIGLLSEAHERFWGYADRDEEPPIDGFDRTTRAISLFYKATRKGKGKMVTLAPEDAWFDPEKELKIPWVFVQRERDKIKAQIDKAKRRDEMLKQALLLEAGKHDDKNGATEKLIIPPHDAEGNLVLKKEKVYSRTSVTVNPKSCKHCKGEIQKGREQVRFQ